MTKQENGDQRFDVLYHTRYRAVYGYYRACGLSDSEASDLAQDAFLRLWQRMDQIRGEDPWPFLQSIARTVLLNWLRHRKTGKGGGDVKLVDIDDPDFKHDIPAPSGPDSQPMWSIVPTTAAGRCRRSDSGCWRGRYRSRRRDR